MKGMRPMAFYKESNFIATDPKLNAEDIFRSMADDFFAPRKTTASAAEIAKMHKRISALEAEIEILRKEILVKMVESAWEANNNA